MPGVVTGLSLVSVRRSCRTQRPACPTSDPRIDIEHGPYKRSILRILVATHNSFVLCPAVPQQLRGQRGTGQRTAQAPRAESAVELSAEGLTSLVHAGSVLTTSASASISGEARLL